MAEAALTLPGMPSGIFRRPTLGRGKRGTGEGGVSPKAPLRFLVLPKLKPNRADIVPGGDPGPLPDALKPPERRGCVRKLARGRLRITRTSDRGTASQRAIWLRHRNTSARDHRGRWRSPAVDQHPHGTEDRRKEVADRDDCNREPQKLLLLVCEVHWCSPFAGISLYAPPGIGDESSGCPDLGASYEKVRAMCATV
jgi:hypothetical protein